MPACSVIIPTYNRAELLRRTLDSLVRQDLPRAQFEVLVIDDGSSDHTAELAGSYADRLDLRYFFQPDEGWRVAQARNVGIAHAAGAVCVMVDSGVLLHSGCLRAHLDSHQRADGPVAVIGYVYGFGTDGDEAAAMIATLDEHGWQDPDAVLALVAASGRWADVRELFYAKYADDFAALPAPWIVYWTCNVSAPTDRLRAVGGFDEQIRSWGGEDLELAYRLHPVRAEPGSRLPALPAWLQPGRQPGRCARRAPLRRGQARHAGDADAADARRRAELPDLQRRRHGPRPARLRGVPAPAGGRAYCPATRAVGRCEIGSGIRAVTRMTPVRPICWRLPAPPPPATIPLLPAPTHDLPRFTTCPGSRPDEPPSKGTPAMKDDIRQFLLQSLKEMNYSTDGIDDDTVLGPAGADLQSLALAELAVRVEDQYGVRFDDDEAEMLAGMTVGEFAELVAGRAEASSAS
jgi:GT2 family glycosyltransferase/acyl carrier protein